MAPQLIINATGGPCSISVSLNTTSYGFYMASPSQHLTLWYVQHGYTNWVAAAVIQGGSNGWTISGLSKNSITYDVVATVPNVYYPHDSRGLTSDTAIATTEYVPTPVPKPKGFAIGMFGVERADDPVYGGSWTHKYFQSPPFPAAFAGHYSSHLNTLFNDGFNLIHDYNNDWCNFTMASFLKLVADNGMKLLIEEKAFYKPDPPPADTTSAVLPSWVPSWWPRWLKNQFYTSVVVHHLSASGTNIYDAAGVGSSNPPTDANEAIWKSRPNYMSLYQYVYSRPDLKDTVWGHQVTEEAAFTHLQQSTNSPNGLQLPAEVPPINVYSAVTQFRENIDYLQLAQRLIVMEANHARSIQDNTVDSEGYYNVPSYIHGDYWSRYDAFFEGSYCCFPSGLISPWMDCLEFPYSNIYSNGLHYLGFLKSIDYVMNYVPEVHKVLAIDTDPDSNRDYALFHASHLNPNGNWLWFQAYASIVHGAIGIWFWWLRGAWAPGETQPTANTLDYFEHLPAKYTNFVAPLARELRFLLNQGFVHPDPAQSTLVHSKTDSTDSLGIVPPPTSYGFPQLSVDANHMTEQYGIRYAIRKRTSDQQTIMIAVNPLPVHVRVPFNMAPAGLTLSTHVDVLFETAADNPMMDPSGGYKANRNGRVTLPNVASTRQINASGHTFTDTFAPLDVHVYRF